MTLKPCLAILFIVGSMFPKESNTYLSEIFKKMLLFMDNICVRVWTGHRACVEATGHLGGSLPPPIVWVSKLISGVASTFTCGVLLPPETMDLSRPP